MEKCISSFLEADLPLRILLWDQYDLSWNECICCSLLGKFSLLWVCTFEYLSVELYLRIVSLHRYRLRSKVDIENVAEDFSCWQRYGSYLSSKSASGEEPEGAGIGWGSGTDLAATSSSQGNEHGWQWFKDPRLESLGYRGIFPLRTEREFSLRNYCPNKNCRFSLKLFRFFLARFLLQHPWLRLTKRLMKRTTFSGG